MSPSLSCPQCGESEELRGEQTPDGIRVHCGTCSATWLRDTAPRCATCGGGDIVVRPRLLTQFSRGTQLSVVGWQDVPCCSSCDAEALAKSTAANAPLPAGYQPAAMTTEEVDN